MGNLKHKKKKTHKNGPFVSKNGPFFGTVWTLWETEIRMIYQTPWGKTGVWWLHHVVTLIYYHQSLGSFYRKNKLHFFPKKKVPKMGQKWPF